MNRFRKLGFIEYRCRIQVHKSLPNMVLLDQLYERSSEELPTSSDAGVPPDERDANFGEKQE
jgi:hypothetical protein